MRRALVTGGTRGIGFEVCKLLLEMGYCVTALYSKDEKSAKEKEADISTSLSWCSYTPRLVNNKGFEPLTFASVAQRSIQLS